MKKIGLIGMSAKPFHAGHEGLIKTASSECDTVKLFVSISDRKRKNEITISGAAMKHIWDMFIEPTLPNNVHVEYGGSPIRKIYEFLGAENEAGSEDLYFIYSDPDDLQKNFPQKSLEKYLTNIYHRRQIHLEPIHRTSTVDVSGTKMRSWIQSGDKENFIKHLPSSLRASGEEIFNLLKLK